MKNRNAHSLAHSTPHAAIRPLQMAAKAIEEENWLEAQKRLDLVSAQLAARAAVLDEDLRQRHESMALRLAFHAKTLRERLHQISAQATPTKSLTPIPAAHESHRYVCRLPDSEQKPSLEIASLSQLVCPPAIRELLMARFVLPLRHPAQAARYRQRTGGGLLLFGPPGTGKTHLVRALGKELGVPVFVASPAQLVSKWLGDSEKQLAELFAKARQEPEALVFVDEIDVLAPSRDQQDAGGSGVMQRLLAQMLTELDGFEKRSGGLLFVGATNRPWVLDKALLRQGRFDAMAYLGTPGRAARVTLLHQALAGMPMQKDMAWQAAGAALHGRTAAQVLACANQAARCAFERSLRMGSDQDVLLEDLLQAASNLSADCEQDHQRFSEFAVRHGAVWPAEEEGGVDEEDTEKPSLAPLRFVQARDLHMDVQLLPFASYALQHAGLGSVRQISICNQGAEESQNLLVEVSLVPEDLGAPWSTTIAELPTGECWRVGPLTLPLKLGRLRQVLETEQAHLKITVRDRSEVLIARTEPLPLLAYNEWVYLPDFLELTAAYVQCNSPALHPAIQRASARLGAETGSGSFSGYQTGGAKRVKQMLLAIHQMLSEDQGLEYINPPPSFEQSGQKVRLVADTLEQGRGTCLDLALLQAALWEHVGLNPVLILVPGHALLACWMEEPTLERDAVTILTSQQDWMADGVVQGGLRDGHLMVINSVEVAYRQTLDAAHCRGLEIVQNTLKGGHAVQLIDISASRRKVTPLP